MAKVILFCADGTWNGPEDTTGQSVLDSRDVAGEIAGGSVTNVVKLFANLQGRAEASTADPGVEQEKTLTGADGSVLQVMKYLHGVGDSSNPIMKFLGGAFGFGVIARIVRGYTFISRCYLRGDAIVICGFSRGAYTARALAGMIAKTGLLNPEAYDPQDRSRAYLLGIAAWARSKSVALQGGGLLMGFASAVLNFVEHVVAEPLPPDALLANIPIRAVAVWDTVGAMGIPAYAADRRYDLFRFVDQDLHPAVESGFHAMAVDELRADFAVTRWTQDGSYRPQSMAGLDGRIGSMTVEH